MPSLCASTWWGAGVFFSLCYCRCTIKQTEGCRNHQLKAGMWQNRRKNKEADHPKGVEVNENCIHMNYLPSYWSVSPCPPRLRPLMRYNGVLLCELDLWGHAGVEGGELWLFTDVLYPIIFMLSGGSNGKHGLNGAFHMWSNSLLTSGISWACASLLLSCINWWD